MPLSKVPAAAISQPFTQTVSYPTTSGAYVDIPIPSWARWIQLLLNDVSFAGSPDLILQAGTAAGLVTTGYKSGSGTFGGTSTSDNTFFRIGYGIAGSNQISGIVTLASVPGNTWMLTAQSNKWSGGGGSNTAGKVDLSAALTFLRLTGVTADTFDGGSVTAIYQG
jgi:hypothetical protein